MPVFNPDPASSLPQNDDLQPNDLQPAPIDLDKLDEPALSAPADDPLVAEAPAAAPEPVELPAFDQTPAPAAPEQSSVFGHVEGLSAEEKIDPNRIQITIKDREAPIVVLYGPPSCGKTMTLVRLTRYLKRNGYQVSAVRSLRPSDDRHYADMCNGFNDMINSIDAAKSTDNLSFMLVEVTKDGRRICQILEAPGEGYFYHGAPGERYPKFINDMLALNMRKIYCVIVEPDGQSEQLRNEYVDRLAHLKHTHMDPRDKVIFVFNKIDLTNFVYGRGRVHLAPARKEVAQLYPGIFAPFRNENPITRFWREWNCDFVPFQTGSYTRDAAAGLVFTDGPDEYPHNLWKTILKCCRG